MRLKVAIIGCGNHSREFILPNLSIMPGTEIVGVSSRNRGVLDVISEQYHIECTNERWNELLNDVGANAVVVVATPQVNKAVHEYCAPRGISVFLEKPPAESLSALIDMCALAAQSQSVSFVNYNFRFSQAYELAMQQVSLPDKVCAMHVKFITSKPTEKLWSMASVIASYLYAVGIHPIEMICYQFPKARLSHAQVTYLSGSKFTLDVMIETENGASATLKLGNYSPRFDSSIEVVTEYGQIVTINDFNVVEVRSPVVQSNLGVKATESIQLSSLKGKGGYERALESFKNSVVTEKESESSLEKSKVVYGIIEAIIAAVKCQ